MFKMFCFIKRLKWIEPREIFDFQRLFPKDPNIHVSKFFFPRSQIWKPCLPDSNLFVNFLHSELHFLNMTTNKYICFSLTGKEIKAVFILGEGHILIYDANQDELIRYQIKSDDNKINLVEFAKLHMRAPGDINRLEKFKLYDYDVNHILLAGKLLNKFIFNLIEKRDLKITATFEHQFEYCRDFEYLENDKFCVTCCEHNFLLKLNWQQGSVSRLSGLSFPDISKMDRREQDSFRCQYSHLWHSPIKDHMIVAIPVRDYVACLIHCRLQDNKIKSYSLLGEILYHDLHLVYVLPIGRIVFPANKVNLKTFELFAFDLRSVDLRDGVVQVFPRIHTSLWLSRVQGDQADVVDFSQDKHQVTSQKLINVESIMKGTGLPSTLAYLIHGYLSDAKQEKGAITIDAESKDHQRGATIHM